MTQRRLLPLIFILTLSVWSSACSLMDKASNQAPDELSNVGLNLDVKKKVLSNGLTILVVENHKLPIFSYYTFYDVGGRFESRKDRTTGATHFLEHMMFKGAKKYGPGQFDKTIEGSGGSTNAYTTFDSTVYYQNLPTKMWQKIIDMEADRMQNLLLIPTSFESERNVILEERKYRYENSPRGQIYLAMMQAMFEGTPYGGSVIGDVKDLKSIQRDDLFRFFQEFYTPNNAIIVIAGDVDADEVFEEVEEKFGGINPSEGLSKIKEQRDNRDLYQFRGNYNRSIKIHGSSPTPMFMLAYKGLPLGERKAFVMDILSTVIGDGQSSWLYQRYVKSKHPQLTRISASNYNLKHNGVFFISGELQRGVSLKRFKQKLLKDMKRICGEAINDREVQKTKNKYMIDFYEELKTNAGVASFLGLRENFFGDYNFYKKELSIYNSIGVEEVTQVCEDLFKEGDYIFVSLWDKHKKK